MLLAVYLYEDFIDKEGVTVAAVLSLLAAGINSSELDAEPAPWAQRVPWVPEPDGLAADSDASFSEQIFDIPAAEIETVVEPDSVGNDIGWESVAFVSSHPAILSILVTLLGDILQIHIRSYPYF
jgi:hypothetical protein